MSKIMLCGRPGKCCPVVDIDSEPGYKIVFDDFGGKIKMTDGQWEVLRQKIKFGEL